MFSTTTIATNAITILSRHRRLSRSDERRAVFFCHGARVADE